MNKKLHILFLNGWYPSRVLPTNGDFIKRHAEAVALKHKVTSIHVISDPNLTKTVEIIEQDINDVRTFIGYIKPTYTPFKILRFCNTYKKIFDRINDFDVIHVNKLYPIGIIALFLKFFKKKPYLISEHWTGYQINTDKISLIEKKISKKIASNANYLCPVSKNLASKMQQFGLFGNYSIVPNVVDTDLFKPTNVNSNKFNILHVSNMLDEHKNVSGILRTVCQLKVHKINFKLYLVGTDSNKYKSLIDSLLIQNNIEIVDQIEHSKVVNYMQKADVFVLFSNYENLPCVILESFACGTPVITTDVGGISEYFPENFGYLIPKNDEDALLNCLVETYNEKNKKTPQNLMHSYVKENFSPEVISNSFTKLYEDTIKK